MPIVFTDEVWFFHIRCHILFRLTSLCFSIMHKIIVGIHIFQQTAFSICTHTTCRSRIIEFMRRLICSSVKCIIILRFINTHAPENDRSVIPVLFHHIPDIFHCLIFPCSITDMLPSRNFGKNKQPYFITPLYKIMGLWKPETAPQATVTNRMGNMVPSFSLLKPVKTGRFMVGWATSRPTIAPAIIAPNMKVVM